MKPLDRRQQILDLVNRQGDTPVEALARRFGVSAETIRRDLAALSEGAALQKVHGGARPLRLLAEGSFAQRMTEDVAAKSRIGGLLRDVVAPGETLFMDTGTTTLACAQALGDVPDLTVITNSLRIAATLGGSARVFLLGGSFATGNDQTFGPLVIDQIGQFEADHAVLTVAALDAGAGAMDADFEEAQVARAMIARARDTVVVAHGPKLGRRAAFRICSLPQIHTLVCDRQPDAPLASALAEAGVVVRDGTGDGGAQDAAVPVRQGDGA